MIRHGLAYDVTGEGEPLLMVNGIGAARESWSRQIGDLSARFRCTTFDNRGVGESIIPAGPYTTREMADDAARVLSAAGVSKARVLGVSMGGAIAQELAINHPQLVERLAIVCSWAVCDRYLERCFVIMKEMTLSEGPKGPGWSIPVQRFLSLIGFAHGDFTHAVAEIDELEAAVADSVEAGKEQPYAGFVAQADACLTHDARDRIASIEAPTLILAGDEGVFTPLPLSRALADAIPGARLQMMAGCGHVMFYERPKDFNSRIIDFLA